MSIGYQFAIPANTAGARRSRRWKSWARGMRGRAVRLCGRLASPAMELLLGRSGQHTTIWVSRTAGLQLHSRIHLAWHHYAHSATSSLFSYAGTPAAAASPLPRPGETLPRLLTVEAVKRQGGYARESTAPPVRSVTTLRTQATFLLQHHERSVTPATSPAAVAYASAWSPGIAITALPRTVAIRVRRVEEPMPQKLPEVAKASAGSRATAVSPAVSAAQTQPPALHDQAVVETVHVAPWLKATPPPANIEQIADQVIRHIDSRVIAWRERMGRI